jgi:hypothetical protein
MAYKVFISHSTRDRGLVIALSNLLTRFGIEVFVAEWYLTPGEPIDKKVFSQIEKADCFLVLLTKNGMRSNWVQQEIGYAFRTHKLIIPLLEKGTDSQDLGALEEKEYIEYDPLQPEEAFLKTSKYVKSLKLKKEEKEKTLLIAGSILALLLLLSGGEK